VPVISISSNHDPRERESKLQELQWTKHHESIVRHCFTTSGELVHCFHHGLIKNLDRFFQVAHSIFY